MSPAGQIVVVNATNNKIYVAIPVAQPGGKSSFYPLNVHTSHAWSRKDNIVVFLACSDKAGTPIETYLGIPGGNIISII